MQTGLTLKNGSGADVTIYLTLGGKDPNSSIPVVTDVSQVTFDPSVTLNGGGMQASFTLAKDATVALSTPDGVGINGNLSYDFPPTQCNSEVGSPPRNGTTLFEFNLNSGQENVDISCVGGINAQFSCTLNGGDPWNANGQPATTMENKAFGANKGQMGVYPYGCDTCTASTSPPGCITPGKDNEPPQDEPICNVHRNAYDAPGGGTVEVTFVGAL